MSLISACVLLNYNVKLNYGGSKKAVSITYDDEVYSPDVNGTDSNDSSV